MSEIWQFISNRPKGMDVESRRAIRSAAMKTFRREQRLKRMRDHEEKETNKESPLRDDVSGLDAYQLNHEKNDESGTEIHTLSQAKQFVPLQGSSVVNFINNRGRSLPGNTKTNLEVLRFYSLNQKLAFETAFGSGFGWLDFTAQRTPQCYQLLSHFMKVLAPMLLPLGNNNERNPVTSEWGYRALTSPIFLSATLYHCSVHLDRINRRPWTEVTLYHRGEAIRLISEQLSTSEPIDENLIAAVALVGGAGVRYSTKISTLSADGESKSITGDVNTEHLHWEAAKRMVDSMGGIAALGWNGALEALLSMYVLRS
ncbi:hypothetical protein BGZ60DRAFT_433574 [Tricladium varicosporioides]|nr:hypothetical protein BGZ60DRAFT_433574 [Hymenoscyphus varicosporioides]